MSGGGDYTRVLFDSRRDHSGVLMQQGRLMLDADVNEFVQIIDRRWRAETMDVIGRCTVPRETPDAFHITVSGGKLTIGRGRLYVDGLLAENHGTGGREYDRSLGEERGTEPIDYDKQPYLPDAPALPTSGQHLVYADVWEREVTYLEEPDLVEKAVGVDTTTRLQTVWQVKLFDPSPPGEVGEFTCDTADEAIPGWMEKTAPSAGRLTTGPAAVAPVDDPFCLLPPTTGYRGLENHLYRVEIHDGGTPGVATFKWSRDNASFATEITAINPTRDELSVVRVLRDSVLRFSPDDWVEITDDRHELTGKPGVMRQVLAVDEATRTIALKLPLDAGEFDATDPSRHTRVRRWDQKGKVRDEAGSEVGDVDASGGVIPVPTTPIVLEHGIKITLTTDPVGGAFRVGDHWVFTARTADVAPDASIEALDKAPPRGVVHHYCRLAVVDFPDVTDCRTMWPPEGAGEGCDCAVCVTPESHNTGTLTIQFALDQVKVSGGKVCLGPGVYKLSDPLSIRDGMSVRLQGSGWRTILLHMTAGPAIHIERSLGVTVEDLSIVVAAFAPEAAVLAVSNVVAGDTGLGVLVRNSVGARIHRCSVLQLGRLDGDEPETGVEGALLGGFIAARGAAIALTGFVVQTSIQDNVLAAGSGVLTIAAKAGGTGEALAMVPAETAGVVVANLFVEDNVILAPVRGVSLDGVLLHVLETRIAGNLIAASRDGGIVTRGTSLGSLVPSHVNVQNNTVLGGGDGVIVGTDDVRVERNDIGSLRRLGGGDGIVLDTASEEGGIDRCQVMENRVTGIKGNAISIRGQVVSGMIKDNVVQGTGGGIVMEERGRAADLAIENNQVLDVGPEDETASPQAGIRVVRADRVRVSGNTIRGVGRSTVQAPSRAGIQVLASASVAIGSNEIGDVGPATEFINEGAGVDVSGPFERLDVVDNVIQRSKKPDPEDPSAWRAVRVRSLPPVSGPPGFLATLALFAVGDTVFGFAGDTVFELPRGREIVSVRGNLVDAYGRVPAVDVTASGACVVSDNRCKHHSPPSPGIRIHAGAVIAGGNYIEAAGDVPALVLNVGEGPFTVVGNVTSGPIHAPAAGQELGAPWGDLNVVAS